MPQALRPHGTSGNGETGGMVSGATQQLSSSGGEDSSSLFQRMNFSGVGDVLERRAGDHRAVIADVVVA